MGTPTPSGSNAGPSGPPPPPPPPPPALSSRKEEKRSRFTVRIPKNMDNYPGFPVKETFATTESFEEAVILYWKKAKGKRSRQKLKEKQRLKRAATPSAPPAKRLDTKATPATMKEKPAQVSGAKSRGKPARERQSSSTRGKQDRSIASKKTFRRPFNICKKCGAIRS